MNLDRLMSFENNIRDRFNLEGRVAVITGASKGIGAAIAKGLAEFGASVVVSSRKLEAVEAVAEEIRSAGGKAHAEACHVGDPLARKELITNTLNHFGSLDILVNNAAINCGGSLGQ